MLNSILNTAEYNPYTTKIYMDKNKSLSNYERWLYVEGAGKIDQFYINSLVNDYKLKIIIDDHEYFNENYSFFALHDNFLSFLDAQTSGANYVLTDKDIYFNKSFSIEITPTTTGVFNVILCRYTIRNDKIKK